jgi:co-chaperonin GroES (HSP10)
MFSFKLPKLSLLEVTDLKPAKGLLIVAPIELPDVQQHQSGLLVVTGTEEDKTKNFPIQFGRVIAVGDDIEDFEPGQDIFYHKYSGQDGDMLTDRFRMVRKEEVWGIAVCKTETKKTE